MVRALDYGLGESGQSIFRGISLTVWPCADSFSLLALPALQNDYDLKHELLFGVKWPDFHRAHGQWNMLIGGFWEWLSSSYNFCVLWKRSDICIIQKLIRKPAWHNWHENNSVADERGWWKEFIPIGISLSFWHIPGFISWKDFFSSPLSGGRAK